MVKNLKVPPELPEDGILVGYSLEHERPKKVIGFSFAEETRQAPETGYLTPILYEGDGHLMTIAPTGMGKGVSCVVPTLLRYQGPIIVIDPKGENYSVTARRRREIGHEVVLLDPFNVTGEESQSINPLDLLVPKAGDRVESARALAEILMHRRATGRMDPFWDDMAQQMITGLLLHVTAARPPILRNLGELHYLLYQSYEDFQFTIKEMRKSKDAKVRMMAGPMQSAEPKVQASIRSTAQSHVDFLSGDQVQQSVHQTSFSLKDVTDGKPLSIYLVVPPEKLESHGPLLRLWIGTLMTALTRRRSRPKNKTLFILDETAQLGELQILRQAITLMRGYGLQTWTFWQDLSQLKKLYADDWETMFNNSHVFQTFGCTNMRLARTLHSLTGLHSPPVIMGLDTDEMILMLAGDQPVIAQKPNYLNDPGFKGAFDKNPYYVAKDKQKLKPLQPQRTYDRAEFTVDNLLDELDAWAQGDGTEADIRSKASSSQPSPSAKSNGRRVPRHRRKLSVRKTEKSAKPEQKS